MKRTKVLIALGIICLGLSGCGVNKAETISRSDFNAYVESVDKIVKENEELSSKVKELEDTMAVEEVTNNLFIQTDNMDWDAMVSDVFTEKVYFDMTSVGGTAGEVTSRSIVDGWEQGFQAIESVHHQGGNMQIDIDGDSAKVFLYGTATQYANTQSGDNTRTFIGSYDLGLIRENDTWKVNSFKFNLKMMDGNITLE